MSEITNHGAVYEDDLQRNWAAAYAKRLNDSLSDTVENHVAALEGADRDVLANAKEYADAAAKTEVSAHRTAAVLDHPNGSVTNEKLADYCVNTIKIAQGAINNNHISNGAVDARAILDGSVTTAKIADGAVTAEKLADDSVTTTKLATGAVQTGKILDGAVTAAKLATGAVNEDKIAAGAITAPKLTDEAVTTEKIRGGAVTTTELATGAVTTAKIADKAVTNAKLADLAVDTYNLADGAVTNAKLCSESVTNDNLVSGAVDVRTIADGSITLEKLAATLKTRVIIGDTNVTTADGIYESGIYQYLGGATIQVTENNTYKTTKNITAPAGILLVSDSDGDIIQILFCGERDTYDSPTYDAHPMQIYWRYLARDVNNDVWVPSPWMLVNHSNTIHSSADTEFGSDSDAYDTDTYSAQVIDNKIDAIASAGTSTGLQQYSTTPQRVGTWIDGTPIWRWAFDEETSQYGAITGDPSIGHLYMLESSGIVSDNTAVKEIAGFAVLYNPGNQNRYLCALSVDGFLIPSNYTNSSYPNIRGWIEFATPESNIVTETEGTI
ncbi:MAG: hypothetical protein ACI38A_06880 [Candidatus Ornithomonoglobus sp.]